MCGIAGCIGQKDEDTISRMCQALAHRGPDDHGLFSTETFTFGHTRLSIVDVAGGHQPILSSDRQSGIIANGEIYNFKALRNRLETRYRFSTRSDSETILHLYRDKGPESVRELDGMFAFAVFDLKQNTFFLARDPLGIKPLYYGYKKGAFYFSSELGAMSYSEVPEVHEFPAGHYYTPETGFVRYYSVPPVREESGTGIDTFSGSIRETFIRAVEKRLLADPQIPVGAFCSGGLDSSLIAAVAALRIPNLHTFVVGMQTPSGQIGDDIQASRMVARHIGSTHHEYLFTEADYIGVLHRVIQKLETYDPSLVRCAVPCYFTCKAASEYCTVVLTGEGADEVFNGYQYMKRFPLEKTNEEGRRLLTTLHNINLQRTDRMGMWFGLELRVPFLDRDMVALGMKIPAAYKIREHNGQTVEKWILRKAFEGTGLIPESVLWRTKVQYTQGAGCETIGYHLAEKEISDGEFDRIRAENPEAVIHSKEAALYFKIFRQYHPQDSILKSIGIWEGFEYQEERTPVRGTV